MKIRRIRPEAFGALVATEGPAALVSVDRLLAARLGAQGGALWAQPDPGLGVPSLTGPTEAHLAVSERCPAACTGCYVGATPQGHEPTHAALVARLEALAQLGTFHVAFGGGEPSLRADLFALAARARALGLVPTVTTSGLGVDPRNAHRFRVFSQVNVSWDGPPATYQAIRGWDGAALAERTLRTLGAAGVTVGVNAALSRALYPHLGELGRASEAAGAVELQLLRYKPSGRGGHDYADHRLDDAQIAALPALLRSLSRDLRLALRIDCAMVPYLAGDPGLAPQDLRRFGVIGCEGGRSLVTIDARGGARPCSVWEDVAPPVDAARAWPDEPTLAAFRAHAAAPPEPCARCAHRDVCRGGCRVVALHVSGSAWAADPECPVVRAHEARRALAEDGQPALRG